MLKICLFGNSHLGALKLAAGKLSEPKSRGLDLLFWGAAGKYFPLIKLVDGKFVSPIRAYSRQVADGRLTDLDVKRFDIVVFYGCHVDISRIADTIVRGLSEQPGLSRAFRRRAIQDVLTSWWERLAIVRLLQEARPLLGERRSFFYAHPLWSEGATARFPEREMTREVLEEVQKFVTVRMSVLGVEARRQPASTIVDGIATAEAFSVGSVKLNTQDVAHPVTDFAHMNGDFGDAVLRDLLGALSVPKAEAAVLIAAEN